MNSSDFIERIAADKDDKQLLLKILSAIKSIKCGHVRITIQDPKRP